MSSTIEELERRLAQLESAANETADPRLYPERVIDFDRDDWDALEVELFGSPSPWFERVPSDEDLKLARKLLPDIQKRAPILSWVYFIQRGESGPIKIGLTGQDVQSRLRTLQVGSPERLELVLAAPGYEHHEGAIHSRFRSHRLGGEWFRPHRDLLEFIQACRYLRPDEKLLRHWQEVRDGDSPEEQEP